MKSFIFSLLFTLMCSSLTAQTVQDTLSNRDDINSERYMSRWEKFVPCYSKVQVAGGMGVVSMGVGWEYGKRRQWETDMMIGILPKFSGDRTSLSFTLKQNYIPWQIPVGNKLRFEPLETGVYVNMLSSHDFWLFEPEKYNPPYYFFATNLRIHVFVGQRVILNLGKHPKHKILTLFYEISSNDMYMATALGNRDIKLYDIAVLSFGLKVQLFNH